MEADNYFHLVREMNRHPRLSGQLNEEQALRLLRGIVVHDKTQVYTPIEDDNGKTFHDIERGLYKIFYRGIAL